MTGSAGTRTVTTHPTTSRRVIRVVLDAQLSRGVMAAMSGPLTPVFGDDEALRLAQYGTALAPALDRVMLVERMRRSAQLIDLAYDAVTTWNVRTQLITFWNKGAEELYGWGPDEAIGRDPGELLRSELPEGREAILTVLREVGRWEGEIIQTTRSGARIHVAVRWALQKDGAGSPDAVMEIGRDVTADKVAAAQLRDARDVAEQASQAKSEYLSRMSHELRTPLTAILGYSDLLEMREPREDQTEAIAAVQEASGHLLSLVNDVLDIARIEFGPQLVLAGTDPARGDGGGVRPSGRFVGAQPAHQDHAIPRGMRRRPCARRPSATRPGAAQPAVQRGQVFGQRRAHLCGGRARAGHR